MLDGPFAETKELIAGYSIWEVSSMDETIEGVKRSPFRDGVIALTSNEAERAYLLGRASLAGAP